MADGGPITFQMVGGVPVFLAPPYFAGETGQELHQQVAQLFQQGSNRLVIDFRACKVVTSPGISSLMDLALKLGDDYRGKMAFANLDQVKTQVFTLVGVVPLVPLAQTVEEAVALVKG
jgi:hypothetical protein